MPAPFYNAIKGTTGGAPGTGAFTPNAAATGFSAWSNVPTGWIGLVRYEDGLAWELAYSNWNGSTLSRGANQVVKSSTGSVLTLTSAATAAFVIDGSEVMSHLGSTRWSGYFAITNATTLNSLNMNAPALTGTAAAVTLASTNALTEQPRLQLTSVTTINGQAGVSTGAAQAIVNTTAGRGGFEFVCRLGASQLPTGPRLFVGMTSGSLVGSTSEPSAIVAHLAAFGLDSTDTNVQLITNSNAGGSTKIDTGIPLVANGVYEFSVWSEPGSNTVNALLIRLDTGAIFFKSTSTDVPATGSGLFPNIVGGLNGTNTGTAFIMQFISATIRSGQ